MKFGELNVDLFKKILKKNVYIGNIKKCTKYSLLRLKYKNLVVYKSDIFAEDAVLVKVNDDPRKYIRIEFLDFLVENKIYYGYHDFEETLLSTRMQGNDLWIDSYSLRPYYNNKKGKVKIKEIKKIK